jgi:hypothetical protein
VAGVDTRKLTFPTNFELLPITSNQLIQALRESAEAVFNVKPKVRMVRPKALIPAEKPRLLWDLREAAWPEQARKQVWSLLATDIKEWEKTWHNYEQSWSGLLEAMESGDF